MKRRAIATTAIAALLMLGAATGTFALAANSNHSQSTCDSENDDHNESDQAQTASTTSSTSSTTITSTTSVTCEHENDDHNENDQGQKLNLTVGETLSFSGLSGHWVVLNHTEGDDESHDPKGVKSGTSTGSFTFHVTSHSDDGFNLTITAGSFTINGTTHTVTGGHITLNEGGESGFGKGTASGGATFVIHVAGIHGNSSTNAKVGAIKLDVKIGKSEYLVILGSSEGVEENDHETD